MNTEQIKDKVKTILSLPSGSAGRGVIGRGTAQAMLDVIEALEAERDSYRASFNNERIRADLAAAQCDDIRATISGPSKEIDNLKLRIESLAARVDVVEATAPTPFAYNAACQALHNHRERADAAEEQVRALAAENARCKFEISRCHQTVDEMFKNREKWIDKEWLSSIWSTSKRLMDETPATDAALREIRAQAVEGFGSWLSRDKSGDRESQMELAEVLDALEDHTARIRSGEQP